MIRQAQKASTSLACYSSLASLAYEGGAARDGGSKDIGAPLLALLKQAYAPFVITSQLASAAAGKTNGLTVRITNPNAFPLEVSDLSIALPAGVARVRSRVRPRATCPKPVAVSGRLSWRLKAPVGPFKAVAAHLVLRDAKAGTATVTGSLTVSSPDGTHRAPRRPRPRYGSFEVRAE